MLMKEEKETIINFNETHEPVSVYTYNRELKRRLERYARNHPDLATLTKVYDDGAVCYLVNKDRLSIRLTAPYSEERRKAAAEFAKQHSKLCN